LSRIRSGLFRQADSIGCAGSTLKLTSPAQNLSASNSRGLTTTANRNVIGQLQYSVKVINRLMDMDQRDEMNLLKLERR
jgi:hypothetical protein